VDSRTCYDLIVGVAAPFRPRAVIERAFLDRHADRVQRQRQHRRVHARAATRHDRPIEIDPGGIEGAADRVMLPLGHTKIASSDETIRCVLAFLKNGRFPD
jgi:hypothetical protein